MMKFFFLLIFVSVSVAKKVNGGRVGRVAENSENIRAYILSLRNYNPISATSQPSVTHPLPIIPSYSAPPLIYSNDCAPTPPLSLLFLHLDFITSLTSFKREL